jgi:hypothetical protein
MQSGDRRDPLEKLLQSGEPAVDLQLTGPATSALTRRPVPGARKTPVRPSEQRRKARMLTVTFSDAKTPARIRALADRWGLVTVAGQPNLSAVIETLLLPALKEAEQKKDAAGKPTAGRANPKKTNVKRRSKAR